MKLIPAWRAGTIAVGVIIAGSAGADESNAVPNWEGRCSSCHGDASDFARTLHAVNDVLLGNDNARPVGEFLIGHRGLNAERAEAISTALEQLLRDSTNQLDRAPSGD